MTEPAEEQVAKPLKVSVVVVSHNRVGLLRRCLTALEASVGRDEMEFLVVDNGSSDGSAQLESTFPRARFIRIPRNFGLTKGMNLGWRAAQGDYVLFLHEDTEVSPETVQGLAACLDADTDVTAAAPLLVTAQGKAAPQIGNVPPDGVWRPVFDDGAAGMPKDAGPVAVDYARGAALMIRKFFLSAMREIDARYGQFGSDADLCYQIRRAGKKILVLPNLRTVHAGGDDSPLRQADMRAGIARWLGKYQGAAAATKARIGSALAALSGFRLSEFRHIVSGKKIDGTQ